MDDKTETLKKVGALLREARGPLSLNKAGLKIGVSTAYLSDVERGHRTVSAARLRQIAEAVGMKEAERQRLFVSAQMLPPAVTEQVLRAPQAWSYSYRRLFEVAQEIQRAAKTSPALRAALGDKTVANLNRALQKQDW